MQDKHIVSSFDNDLEQIQAKIMKMGGLVEASIADASNSFLTRDIELAEAVRARDACLLYTSPSPRDGLLSRMPSSA